MITRALKQFGVGTALIAGFIAAAAVPAHAEDGVIFASKVTRQNGRTIIDQPRLSYQGVKRRIVAFGYPEWEAGLVCKQLGFSGRAGHNFGEGYSTGSIGWPDCALRKDYVSHYSDNSLHLDGACGDGVESSGLLRAQFWAGLPYFTQIVCE